MSGNLEKFKNIVNRHFSKIFNLDGRLLLLAILILYFIPILTASFSPNYFELWNSPLIYPLISKMFPPFADLRVITAGAECIRLGYDVLIENPCDPWNRLMNYPRIWSIPAFLGLNQSHTVVLGILCGLLFFIFTFVTIERLNYIEALFYGLILCSPSVMLAVERGNNDLIIFTLLALSLLIMKSRSLIWRCFSYGIILFTAILKIYPIVALTSCFKEKKQTLTFISLSILMAFGIYVVTNFDTIKLVSKATPRAIEYSYGSQVIFDIILYNLVKNYYVFLDASNANSVNTIKLSLVALTISLLLFIAYLLAKGGETLYQQNNRLSINRIEAFRIGSSIYIGTYLIGNNWDYRLSFLLFTIPQILAWCNSQSRLAPISGLALMGIFLTTWLSSDTYTYYFLDELLNWLLFLFFAYTLILTLPNWLKNYIYFQPKNF